MLDAGLEYGTSSDFWITYSVENKWIILNLNTAVNPNSLNLNIKKIQTQIAPGWIS
jgi:hypothetical protein